MRALEREALEKFLRQKEQEDLERLKKIEDFSERLTVLRLQVKTWSEKISHDNKYIDEYELKIQELRNGKS